MVNIEYDRNILEDNFFRKFQQLGLISESLKMFDELEDVFDSDLDTFYVEYDESVDKHILLHESYQFKETRPICYIDVENFHMKEYHWFIIESIRFAWAEFAI